MIIDSSSSSQRLSPSQLAFFVDSAAQDYVALRSISQRQQDTLQRLYYALLPCQEAMDLLEHEVGCPSLGWSVATLKGAVRVALNILAQEIRP